ncbi:hypothetical protein THZG08_110132 [Vibrio owensii]|nr:hypothetical protein THZG08_110132 [Vibrio owensii]CAH1550323.1 hypothetical protein THOA03_110132 [Vibrio owensii]
MSQTVFITGANRGIGLSLTELYLQQGAQVHATSRNLADSKELRALASRYNTLVLHELDVTDYQGVAQLASELPAIDLLINNAGYYGPKGYGFGNTDIEDVATSFRDKYHRSIEASGKLLSAATTRQSEKNCVYLL